MPAGRVAGAGLARAEHGEADPGPVQQAGDGPGRLAGPVLERGRAADQYRYSTSSGIRSPTTGTSKSSPSVQARRWPAPSPRGRRRSRRCAAWCRPRRGSGLHQDLVAAQLQDGVDVLDVDRALLDAGPAGGAGPEHVRPDHVGDQVLAEHGRVVAVRVLGVGLAEQERGLLEQVVAQVGDDQLGREWLAGVPGRALVLAAAALGAGDQVQQPRSAGPRPCRRRRRPPRSSPRGRSGVASARGPWAGGRRRR